MKNEYAATPPLSALRTADRRVCRSVAAALAAVLLAAGFSEQASANVVTEWNQLAMNCIARGISPAVMANELGLSVKTVSTYRARILEKMAMRSNAEIAAYAVRNELVD